MVEYIVVRCRALKTHLLPKQTIQSILMADSIRGIVDILLPTEYGAELSRLIKPDAHSLEKIFGKKLVDRYTTLLKLITWYVAPAFQRKGFMESTLWRIYGEDLWGTDSPPKDIWGFTKAYSYRLELQNIIRILRGKFVKAPAEHIEESLLPLGRLTHIDYNSFLRVDTIDGAVELLRGTVFTPLTEALRLSHESKSTLPLEMQLWTIYYSYLLNALSGIPGEEKEDVRRIVGTEIDAINTLICTYSILYGYSKEFVRRLIIPYSYRVSSNSFLMAARADTTDALKNILSPYAKLVEHAARGDDVAAQVELYRYLRREAERQTMRDTGYAYILSYMLLCEIEYRDLVSATLGKQYGSKMEELKPYIISLA